MAKKGQDEKAKFIQSIIQEGIGEITKHNPAISQEMIEKYLDREAISSKANEIYESLESDSGERKKEYLREDLLKYINSGGLFTENGKQRILGKGLEGKVGYVEKFKRIFRGEPEGSEYLDNTIEAFQDLYSMLKTGDYAQRMPELAKSVVTIYDMGFLNPAVNVLASYGLIDEGRYNTIKRNIKNRVYDEAQKGVSAIEKYSLPPAEEKVAASLLGIIGVCLLFASGTKITGGFIGSLPSSIWGIIGVILIGIAFYLGLRKRTNKGKFVGKKKIVKRKKVRKKKGRR